MTDDYEAKQHYVEFLSPGTFVAESSRRKIEAWDTEIALELMANIKERYGATPYGFRFSTRARKAGELDSAEIAHSGVYYVNVTVRTLEDVEADNDPDEKILRQNMRGNGWEKIVTTKEGWKWTQPLHDADTVLEIPND